MVKNKKKLMKKIIAAMSIVAFSAGLVNISEAAIGRIPSISSRNHDMMQDRNNDRFNRNNRNNRRNDNQVTAPREETNENVNNNNNNNSNEAYPQETTVTNKNENNNSNMGSRRNDISSRRRETPAKIVRDIDRTHDATYDEDDRYKAQRESYFEDDGNGRIVDEQREVVEERRQVSATESDRERGRETIINRYEGENDRRGNRGNRGSRDNGGITVVVNNNIPIENNVNVDVKAENKNENKNDIKVENNTEVTSTNNNNNDNKNVNEGKVEVPITEKVNLPKDESSKIPSDAYVYNGHHYKLFDIASTWYEADQYCRDQGGHLLIIETSNEQNFIAGLVRSEGHRSSYWLGGFKRNGNFMWIDGTTLGYTNWANQQPDNCLGKEEALMLYKDCNPENPNEFATWNDLSPDGTCGNEPFFGRHTFGFICEWDY